MSIVQSAALQDQANPVIRLRSGEIINPMGYQKFHPEEMLNLNRIYRFGSKVDWTVGDHIRLGTSFCKSSEQLQAWVVHEVFESLVGIDCVKPIKHTWPWYVEAENKYLEFVYGYLGLDYSRYDELVSDIDYKCFKLEEDYFFNGIFSSELELVRYEIKSWIPLDIWVKRLFPNVYGEQ